ncbi:hypothetical protein L3i20_v203560 [Paenibacillus sp. L3-i20]|nr:hypothetical protein L3i20_v203560 [Paenibacillus sp. L3-i20]
MTLNLYTYVHNNPLVYVDPSGNKIEFSSKAKEKQKEEYKAAIEYLKKSQTAKALIELLEASKETITIEFIKDDNDRYNYNTNILYWDINSGIVLGDGKSIQSAALGLIHEMGHASQDLSGSLSKLSSIDAIEADNLEKVETPIATELGEFTRKDYYDVSGVYTMRNSTDWGTKNNRPWYWYTWPGNWGKKYDYTVGSKD